MTGAQSCDLLPLADDAECHQLYIYHQGTEPGVLLVFGHFGEHTSLYRQYGTLQVAAPAVRDLQ